MTIDTELHEERILGRPLVLSLVQERVWLLTPAILIILLPFRTGRRGESGVEYVVTSFVVGALFLKFYGENRVKDLGEQGFDQVQKDSLAQASYTKTGIVTIPGCRVTRAAFTPWQERLSDARRLGITWLSYAHSRLQRSSN